MNGLAVPTPSRRKPGGRPRGHLDDARIGFGRAHARRPGRLVLVRRVLGRKLRPCVGAAARSMRSGVRSTRATRLPAFGGGAYACSTRKAANGRSGLSSSSFYSV